MMMDICISGGKSREKYRFGRVISGNLVAGISQGFGGRGEINVYRGTFFDTQDILFQLLKI